MVKRLLQDVLPAGKKSIRHVPLPENRKNTSPEPVIEEKPVKKVRRSPVRVKRLFLTIGILLAIAAVFIGFSSFFAKAVVTVVPKQLTSPVDVVVQSGTAAGFLPHTVITATTTLTENIAAGKEEQVQRKATGRITIYNNYSTASQRLIKNTRFEAPDGRIYRIDTSIVVPGQTVENGKKVPGSITAVVYADAAGEEYNLLLKDLKGDFVIPGFKGSPRFQAFYARVKTDITGGYSGLAKVVDEKTFNDVVSRLRTTSTDNLWNQMQASLPPGYTSFRTLFSVEHQVVSNDTSQNEVSLIVTAVGRLLAFDAAELSAAVAAKVLPDYKGEKILIQNLNDFDVLPTPQNGKEVWESNPLLLIVKGNGHFVWQFDHPTMKEQLSGKSKRETNGVMAQFAAVDRAEVFLKPFWMSKYPKNLEKIHIQQKLD